MTEITEENFLDLMLGPDDGPGSPGAEDDYGGDASGGEAPPAAPAAAAAAAPPDPAPAAADAVEKDMVDLIERDFREAEVALSRRHRNIGE